MAEKTDPLKVGSNEIVAKVIDGEAIIINLSNGLYYSSVGTGAVVWSGIEAGKTLQEIVEGIAARFDQVRAVIELEVTAFVSQLETEGLIAVANGHSAQTPWNVAASNGKEPYASPRLSRFGDMAHFFALDPPLPDLDDPDSSPADG